MIVWKSEFNKEIDEIKLLIRTKVTDVNAYTSQLSQVVSALEGKIKALDIDKSNDITILQNQFNRLKSIMGAILKAYPALGEVKVYPEDSHVVETGTPQSNEPTPI